MINKRIIFLVVTIVLLALVGVEIIAGKKTQIVWKNPVISEEPVIVAVAATGDDEGKVTATVVSGDARGELIKKYLRKYNSPLVPYADMILDLSKTYELDYRLIVAIAQQESNLCKKIPEGTHNCWGYGIHSKGTLGFDSYDLALKSFAAYLKRVYYDKGLYSVEEIERKYNPTSAKSTGSWAHGVNQFMNQIESGNF